MSTTNITLNNIEWYNSQKVKDLQTILRHLNLSIAGKKHELINRLIDHDGAVFVLDDIKIQAFMDIINSPPTSAPTPTTTNIVEKTSTPQRRRRSTALTSTADDIGKVTTTVTTTGDKSTEKSEPPTKKRRQSTITPISNDSEKEKKDKHENMTKTVKGNELHINNDNKSTEKNIEKDNTDQNIDQNINNNNHDDINDMDGNNNNVIFDGNENYIEEEQIHQLSTIFEGDKEDTISSLPQADIHTPTSTHQPTPKVDIDTKTKRRTSTDTNISKNTPSEKKIAMSTQAQAQAQKEKDVKSTATVGVIDSKQKSSQSTQSLQSSTPRSTSTSTSTSTSGNHTNNITNYVKISCLSLTLTSEEEKIFEKLVRGFGSMESLHIIPTSTITSRTMVIDDIQIPQFQCYAEFTTPISAQICIAGLSGVQYLLPTNVLQCEYLEKAEYTITLNNLLHS